MHWGAPPCRSRIYSVRRYLVAALWFGQFFMTLCLAKGKTKRSCNFNVAGLMCNSSATLTSWPIWLLSLALASVRSAAFTSPRHFRSFVLLRLDGSLWQTTIKACKRVATMRAWWAETKSNSPSKSRMLDAVSGLPHMTCALARAV